MKKRNKSFTERPYKLYPVNLSLRGSSFGIGSRSSLLSLNGKDAPSPLKYYPQFVESSYKGVSLKGYSSDLNIIKRLQNLPGPGSYSPYDQIGDSAPKFSLKPKNSYFKKVLSPAPNAYNPDYKVIQKNTPKYTMPLSIRYKATKDKVSVTPGPGAYKLPSLH